MGHSKDLDDARVDRSLGLIGDLPEPAPDGGHADDGDLVQYRRGQLAEADTRRIEAHLADCRDCRDMLVHLSAPAMPLLVAEAPRPGSRVRSLVLAGALAAAASASFLLLRPPAVAPVEAYLVREAPSGIAEVRGAAPPSRAPPRFLAESRFRAVFEPQGAAATAVVVFYSTDDQRLRRVPDSAVTRAPSGVVKVEGQAGALFGPRAGAIQVWVVSGASAEDVAALEGRSVGELKAARELGWAQVELQMLEGVQ